MPKLEPQSPPPSAVAPQAAASGPSPYRLGVLLLVGLGLWYLTAAFLLPLSQDEAYYMAWGRYLDFGYFDHPPVVAWLTALSALLDPQAWLHGRLASLVLTLVSFGILLRFFLVCGLRGQRWLTACVLLLFNLGSLIAGLVSTPDVGLLFCWSVALHEAAIAFSRDPRRWLSVGLAVGVGLLSKYTMLIIGPVFLLAALQLSPRTLRSPWPYAGACLALLIYLPNLLWNHEHGFVTWKYQLRHGFGLERNGLLDSRLPPAEQPRLGGQEYLLAERLQRLDEASGTVDASPPPPQQPAQWQLFWQKLLAPLQGTLRALAQLIEFLGGQLVFWGALLLPLLGHAWRRRGSEAGSSFGRSPLTPPAGSPSSSLVSPLLLEPLLKTATFFPLGVFAVVSLSSRVEANWSAMYLLAAAPWLASRPAVPRLAALIKAALLNLSLVIALLVHAHRPYLPIRPQADRLLKDTHGYAALSQELASLKGPLFADSYQLVALLNFYEPSRQVQQWPGITRPSEFLRRPTMAPLGLQDLKQLPGFWLITTDPLPPHLPNFQPSTLRRIDDCRQGYLQTQGLDLALPLTQPRPCLRLHRWYAIYYEPA